MLTGFSEIPRQIKRRFMYILGTFVVGIIFNLPFKKKVRLQQRAFTCMFATLYTKKSVIKMQNMTAVKEIAECIIKNKADR